MCQKFKVIGRRLKVCQIIRRGSKFPKRKYVTPFKCDTWFGRFKGVIIMPHISYSKLPDDACVVSACSYVRTCRRVRKI